MSWAIAAALAGTALACVPPQGAEPSGASARAADAVFRTRDTALLEVFAEAKARCAPRWTDDEDCLSKLCSMRAVELRLFADVRAHRFVDVTESNYWHRGRLKFPSEIEQLLARIAAARPGAPRPCG